MGKGGSSCLKIMGCVGDPAENEDLEPVEGKASKRKWSFRKRSVNHIVLNNNVITEPPPVAVNKEDNSEVENNHYNQTTDAHIPAKIPIVKFVEETTIIPPSILESDVSDTLCISKIINDSDSDSDSNIEQSAVIVIQSAIRRYLAQKELMKRKKLVKLQAAIRGHLVRRQAVGTLRCVHAIVKMQALVRAHLLRRSAQDLDNKEGKVKCVPDTKLQSCTEKLLANGFARQLLETPSKRSKVIHISCDPSKCDSAWKWLERWMAVTSSDVTPHSELDPITCIKAKRADLDAIDTTAVLTGTHIPTHEQRSQCENIAAAVGSSANAIATVPLPTEKKESESIKIETSEDLIEAEYHGIHVPADTCADLDESEDSFKCAATDTLNQNELQDQLFLPNRSFGSQERGESAQLNNDVRKGECNSDLSQSSVEPDANIHSESFTERHTVDLEKSRRTTKRMGDLRESDSKMFGFGLRKSCNPAFAAVQSKFEELSATTSLSTTYQEKRGDQKSDILAPQIDVPAKSEIDLVESCCQDITVEQKPDILTAQSSGSSKAEINIAETLLSQEMRIPAPASECGTEISISSTLDSPDRSEAECGEIVLEIGALEKRDYDAVLVDRAVSDHLGSATFENNSLSKDNDAVLVDRAVSDLGSSTFENNSLPKDSEEPQQLKFEESDERDKHTNVSGFADRGDVKQRFSEGASPKMFEELGKTIDQQACVLPHEGSPRNHMTAPESQGTPASQISSSTKRTIDRQTYRLTPEGSSRSHITASESYGTPDSQISTNSNAKRSKTNDSLPSKKPRIQLMGKKSPAEKSIETGPRSTPEHLPKDPKNGKRRNSLGTGKPNGDPETNISTSSLPSYMQATESARAKVHASNSPKASPDVHDKETYARKRHSLPLGNAKQASSPRMQRSTSQMQQSSKTNSTSPHNSAERKWQR